MRTWATFRLFGDPPLTAQAVSDRLGILPTRSHEVGDRVSSRSPGLRKSAAWLLSSATDIEDNVELSTQLVVLLDRLEPLRSQLWALIDEGYRANWFCYVESSATEHAVEIDRQLMSRLLTLPGDLWLDVA